MAPLSVDNLHEAERFGYMTKSRKQLSNMAGNTISEDLKFKQGDVLKPPGGLYLQHHRAA